MLTEICLDIPAHDGQLTENVLMLGFLDEKVNEPQFEPRCIQRFVLMYHHKQASIREWRMRRQETNSNFDF
jgi:hypothetical protein